MYRRKALAAKWYEIAPLLQLRFWKPLRNIMQIFHLLPLAAGVICFILLAIDGQFREIYIAYLEGPNGNLTEWITGLIAAAAMLALLSALLYEAHFSLSTLRIGVVYSGYSNPDANSSPRNLQRTAAFALAILPWLGIAIGLFNARNFVASRYCQLFSQMPAGDLHHMQHLVTPSGRAIAAALVFLGAATATFSCVDQKTRIAQRAVALIAQPLGVLLFLLFTDWLILDIAHRRSIFFIAVTLVVTVVYFIIYQSLYDHRRGPFFTRPPIGSAQRLQVAPPIKVPRTWAERVLAWALSPIRLLIDRQEFSTGVSFGRRQRYELAVWAFFPWLAYACYFAIALGLASSSPPVDQWSQSQSATPPSLCPLAVAAFPPLPGPWAVFPVAICCTVAFGLLTGLALNRTPEHWRWCGVVITRGLAILGLIVVLALVAKALVHFADPDTVVWFYRLIGPLATAALQLVFLITLFAVLAWLSQRSGFPVLSLAILAIVACVMFPNHVGVVALLLGLACAVFAIAGFLAGELAVGFVAVLLIIFGVMQWIELQGSPISQNQSTQIAGAIDEDSVKFKFECWLRRRGISVQDSAASDHLDHVCPQTSKAARQAYAVYIIAAEGGGIYAASAAATLLARLQDDSPHFAEHVFAISGVSGGAIGSTVFQALDRAASDPSQNRDHDKTLLADTCADTDAGRQKSYQQHTLEYKVEHIMEADHLSPVVGAIFPEITGTSTDRAAALVASFENSVNGCDPAAGENLHHPFADNWPLNTAAPGLVLNSTWVETGFRVAFAPFHLHNIDESLYSFSDLDMPQENDQTLMQAAAVSARFPLILPPFSAVMQADPKDPTEHKRWNFVDGGYSDNSGAITALDLYNVLKSATQGTQVQIRVILLTSSEPQPNLGGSEISGTAFRDTMAPIDALMSVRRDLGNQAVARACSEIYPEVAAFERVIASTGSNAEANERCNKHAQDTVPQLQIVEIQDQTYGLSLGWKISRTSFDVVSWMLGKPEECSLSSSAPASANATPQPQNGGNSSNSPAGATATQTNSMRSDNEQLTKVILERNSCVLKSIRDSVQQ